MPQTDTEATDADGGITETTDLLAAWRECRAAMRAFNAAKANHQPNTRINRAESDAISALSRTRHALCDAILAAAQMDL